MALSAKLIWRFQPYKTVDSRNLANGGRFTPLTVSTANAQAPEPTHRSRARDYFERLARPLGTGARRPVRPYTFSVANSIARRSIFARRWAGRLCRTCSRDRFIAMSRRFLAALERSASSRLGEFLARARLLVLVHARKDDDFAALNHKKQ